MSGSAPRLVGEDLVRLLRLVKAADTVELKLTIPADSSRATGAAPGFDPLNAQVRQVFFDTPDLRVKQAGLAVWARRIQGRRSDSVVKLRPVVPSELEPAWRTSAGFAVEVDAAPGGWVCLASLKRTLGRTAVLDVVDGPRALRKLFSKEQWALFDAHAPDGVGIDDLSVVGPIFVRKLTSQLHGFSRPMVAEMWLYPDGSRIVELSNSRGADLDGEKETKTTAALNFFAAELRRTPDVAAGSIGAVQPKSASL